MVDYLLRIDGQVVDTLYANEDLGFKTGVGFILNKEYHVITAIEYVFDFDNKKKIFILDIEHIPYENIPATIRNKIEWDQFRK